MVKSLFLPAPAPAELQRPVTLPLQRINPHRLFSVDTLRRAWVRIRSLGGAAGIDGVTIEKFEADLEANLSQLRADLLNRRYRPQRVLRVFVPKPGGDQRPLALWAVRDKVVQRVVYDCLEPYFERLFLDCSYGYRPGRGVAQVVQAVTTQRDAHRRWVADLDIKKCFDSLDNRLMLGFVRQVVRDRFLVNLIRLWLQARVFNALTGPNTVAGASQGAVISPLLANLYLHQFDRRLIRQGMFLVRYADDVLLFARRKRDAELARQAAQTALTQIRLELNPSKSQVVHFNQGFQFVGIFFVRNEHYVL